MSARQDRQVLMHFQLLQHLLSPLRAEPGTFLTIVHEDGKPARMWNLSDDAERVLRRVTLTRDPLELIGWLLVTGIAIPFSQEDVRQIAALERRALPWGSVAQGGVR